MNFRLDHVVIAVRDLERATSDYRALGFTVQPGGRHPGRTSHNALVVFNDGAYIELIAWESPNPAERWNVEHLRNGDGFMDFALIPRDVPRAIEKARSRGLDLSGPIEGGRVRPDGKELQWRTARQLTFDLPFLCGDITPRELRVPAGEARRHANGATGISLVLVAVRDIDTSIARYAALLGIKTPPPSVSVPNMGLRIATFQVGGTAIVLATPSGPPGSAFAREVAGRLVTREGPCAMAIATGPDLMAGPLDRVATHGALIEWFPQK
ncbi:MAG TPA: VOC family protein [Usitatibacter sp.]|nr:VOC family protein [Usitatibacter sp.]